jgi:hypothetical protein
MQGSVLCNPGMVPTGLQKQIPVFDNLNIVLMKPIYLLPYSAAALLMILSQSDRVKFLTIDSSTFLYRKVLSCLISALEMEILHCTFHETNE